MADTKIQVVALGGGWYVPVGGADDDKFQMSKKDLKKSDYEVVEDEAPAPEAEETVVAAAPITPSSGPEPTEEQIALSQQESWGPYKDYEFVTTPYGEYGVPAGRVLAGFEVAINASGKRYMKPVYEGEDKMRTRDEIAQLRKERADRDQVFD